MLPRRLWTCSCLLAWISLVAALMCGSASAREVDLRQWPGNIPVPAFDLTDLEGRQWNIESLHGKVVLLNFWASWCAPCIDELPFLNQLAAGSDAAKGKLVILGVNFRESMPAIQRFTRENPIRYPIVVDKTGEHFKKWTSGIMPTTILIGQDGRPRWRIVGELDASDAGFRDALEKLLEEPHQGNARRAGLGVK